MDTTSRRFRFLCALLIWAVTLGPAACGRDGSEPLDPEGSASNAERNNEPASTEPGGFDCEGVWEGRVRLTDATQQATGSAYAEYAFDRQADEVRYAFFDGDELPLSELSIRTLDLNDDGTQVPVFELTGSDGRTLEVHADLSAADHGDKFSRIHLNFDETAIQIWYWYDDSRSQIDRLWLAVEGEDGPQDAGVLRSAGQSHNIVEVVTGGRLVHDAELAVPQWLRHHGVEDVLPLTVGASVQAMFDARLATQMRDHGEVCAASTDDIRQALSYCSQPSAVGNPCRPVNDTFTLVLTVLGALVGLASLKFGFPGADVPDGIAPYLFAWVMDLYAWYYGAEQLLDDLVKRILFGVNDFINAVSHLGQSLLNELHGLMFGEPHIRTLDGLAYDFQGAGEYTAAEVLGDEPMNVQVRLEPMGDARCTDVTIVTAVALRYNEQTIEIRRIPGQDNDYLVDGTPVDSLDGRVSVPDGGAFYTRAGRSIFTWPDGSVLEVAAFRHLERMSVKLTLGVSRVGASRGLFGNFNGDWSDEPLLPDGSSLKAGTSAELLYGTFGPAWQVTSETSLFTYGDGEGPQTFAIPDFPLTTIRAEDFEGAQYERARAICLQANVTSPEWLDACIVDVACSDDDTFADEAAQAEPALARLVLVDDGILVDGDIRVSAVPKSVLKNHFESDREIRVFPEAARTLREDLAVDRSTPGLVAAAADLEAAMIPAGTAVQAYMVHVDPTHPTQSPFTATITFSQEVLGVITTSAKLDGSDGFVGARGTVYPREDREAELGDDSFEIEDDRRTIRFRLGEEDGIDELRVVTRRGNQ